MKELQIYKTFIKYLTLLLQCLDVEKAKEDARKIGITVLGAGFLGGMLGQYNSFEAVFLVVIGLIAWLLGLFNQEV